MCRDSKGDENNAGHVNQRVFSLRDRHFARDDLTTGLLMLAKRERRTVFFSFFFLRVASPHYNMSQYTVAYLRTRVVLLRNHLARVINTGFAGDSRVGGSR